MIAAKLTPHAAHRIVSRRHPWVYWGTGAVIIAAALAVAVYEIRLAFPLMMAVVAWSLWVVRWGQNLCTVSEGQ